MQILSARMRFAPSICAFLCLFALRTYARADGTQRLDTPKELIPATYFGMHFHHLGGVTPWPSVPVGEWRLWDCHTAWPDLEPQKGQWRFQTLDAYLTLAAQHNTGVLLPLGLSPRWASARPMERSTYQPGFAAEPRDIDDWREYVATVVRHCKGRVHSYEIWNEPNSKSFWTGDIVHMITLTREASQIIHRIDPQAIVVSPAATTQSGLSWLSQFLAAGGGQFVDVIGYHFYVSPAPPEAMLPLIEQVQQIMRQNGVGEKPLWDTESSWASPKPFPSEELGAAYLARSYILTWAAGVQRFYWYSWDNHGFVVIQTTQADSQTLTPAGQAYGIIQKWLVGARLDSCDVDSEHTWTCKLTRQGAPQWILWNESETKTLSVPPSWQGKTIQPLLGPAQALSGANVQVGAAPELVTTAGTTSSY